MSKFSFILKTDDHLHTAKSSRSNVQVWKDNKIVDYGGIIESISEYYVKINSTHYLKRKYQFRIR